MSQTTIPAQSKAETMADAAFREIARMCEYRYGKDSFVYRGLTASDTKAQMAADLVRNFGQAMSAIDVDGARVTWWPVGSQHNQLKGARE
jgi:hypothetical protein